MISRKIESPAASRRAKVLRRADDRIEREGWAERVLDAAGLIDFVPGGMTASRVSSIRAERNRQSHWAVR
jgi:hypothetical protein